jgi:hypothetical protein
METFALTQGYNDLIIYQTEAYKQASFTNKLLDILTTKEKDYKPANVHHSEIFQELHSSVKSSK